jgi:hypothetical protein
MVASQMVHYFCVVHGRWSSGKADVVVLVLVMVLVLLLLDCGE